MALYPLHNFYNIKLVFEVQVNSYKMIDYLSKTLCYMGIIDTTPYHVYDNRVRNEIRKLGNRIIDVREREIFIEQEEAIWRHIQSDEVFIFYLNNAKDTSYISLKASQFIDDMVRRNVALLAKATH